MFRSCSGCAAARTACSATAAGPACSTRSAAAARPASAWCAPRDYDATCAARRCSSRAAATNWWTSWAKAMEAASARLEFEQAATLRDQIAAIRKVQASQYVEGEQADMDVLACALDRRQCLRAAAELPQRPATRARAASSRSPTAPTTPEEVLAAFVTQYYLEQRAAARDRAQPRDRRHRRCSNGVQRAGRPQGRDSSAASAATARATCRWLGSNAELALATRGRQQRQPAGAPAGLAAGTARPGRAAAAHRVLRHQPHHGRGRPWPPAWCSTARARCAPVPPLQHHRHRPRATTTRPCTRR